MPAEWKIYYKGGAVITSKDHSPQDVPGLVDGQGVLVIVQFDQGTGKKNLLHGTSLYVANWYWWDTNEDSWIGGDDVGLALYLGSPGWKKVLVAQTAPEEEWRQTFKKAVDDHLEWDEADMIET